MAFYFEANAPVWRYKPRYNDWTKFPAAFCLKLERKFKKITKGDSSNVFISYTDDKHTEWRVNVQSMSASQSSGYYRHAEVSRTGYDWPHAGDKKKLKKMFKKFEDKITKGVLDQDNGLELFCKYIGIESDNVQSLILLGLLNVDDVTSVQEKHFVDNLSKCGCSDKLDILKLIQKIELQLTTPKILKLFGEFVFKLSKESPEHKSVKKDQALSVLSLIVPPKNGPLVTDMCKFLSELTNKKTLMKDEWLMIIEFLITIAELETFEDDGTWSSIIDSFVAWTKKK